MYKPTSEGAGGTSLRGYFRTSYKLLVNLFGEPNAKGDEYKVSTEWKLQDEKGNVVTIYEYKETDTYSPGNPSVELFRELPGYDWHIGAQDEKTALGLIEFLEEKKLGYQVIH